MRDAFLIDGVRTPIGNLGGALGAVRPDDLAAHAMRALIARIPSLAQTQIDDVVLGCANQAGEDNRNVARMAALLSGLPHTVPGETVNRLCASGLSAVASAARTIKAGDAECIIAGGVESMTRAPYVLSKSAAPFGRDVQLFDTSLGWRFVNPAMKAQFGTDAMGETAENVAEQFGISRADQDAFALWSQQKATAARAGGRFAEEIAPVSVPQRKGSAVEVRDDEFIRPDTTRDTLATLRPAFRPNGSVTAGNASGLNDGAAALLVATDAVARTLGVAPLARIVAATVTGVEPRVMGIGPVTATQQLLRRTGVSLDALDVIELNEAFAAQALACTRALGLADNDPRVNPNGGAIALGHPLGMSGARLALTAAKQLQRTGGRYALCTMCVGVGQGYALLLERA